jgi:hypothetical protein
VLGNFGLVIAPAAPAPSSPGLLPDDNIGGRQPARGTGEGVIQGVTGVLNPLGHGGADNLPEPLCVLAQATIRNPPADYDPTSGNGVDYLTTADRIRLQNAFDAWARTYPTAPRALVINTVQVAGSPIAYGQLPQGTYTYGVAIVRPNTPYDPKLDLLGQPVIPPGTDQAKAFAAAMSVFFPDFVLDQQTGAALVSGAAGSMTPWGPFPRSVKYVSEQMIELALGVARMPGAFQPQQDTGIDFGSQLLGAVQGGAMATAMTGGNIYAGLGNAAGHLAVSLITDAFSALFGSTEPPPAWLTALDQMKELRGDKSPQGGPSFGGRAAGADAAGYQEVCPVAYVNPTPGGTYTVEDGYAEFLNRLGGGSSRKLPWKWIIILGALGVGIYAFKNR